MTELFDHPALQQPPASRGSARARAAARRRRRRRIRTTIVTVVVLALVGVVGVTTWDWVSSNFTNPFAQDSADFPGPGGDPVEVEIPDGASGGQMAAVLVDAGVVASEKAFADAYTANPGAKGIQAGTYSLLKEMKASDAVAALVKNEKVETKVTIPEGFTAAQVLERISSVTPITREELDAAIADPASIGLPPEADGNVEGWLFPATYVIQPKDTATTLLSQMIGKTTAELDAQDVPAEARLDTLKKASIIEREAPDGFFGEVSRVIANRLEKGEPLGMDAIDAYGLGKSADKITKAEFNDASLPYASRVHEGLPPTPIGNPGAASIKAASHPADGPWLWYVTVNPDTGETKFTDSYVEFLTFKNEFNAWYEANR